MSNPDNTLDDLILTDPEPEKGKSKSLLLLLALVIVLVVVGAILAKMIFSDSDDVADKKENSKIELSTNKLETNALDTNKDSSMDTNISNDLAPINDEPDLAPISINSKESATNTDTINIDDSTKNKVKADITEDKTANRLGVAPVSGSKVNSENIDLDSNSADDMVEEPKPKHTKPKVVHHKPKPKPKKQTYGGVGNVYIQVGSFTKGPEQSFIRKIRRAGFKYRIKTANGYRRVYVGPFRSRSEASNVLGIVRSKIAPNAFIK